MNSPRRHSGFTLLEILLATAMVAVVSLSLYASLRIAFRARDSANNAIGPIRAASLALDLVSRDLESVLSPSGVMAGAFVGQHATDSGNPTDILEYYCVGEGPDRSDPTGWGGMRKVDLGVTTLADGTPNVLIRRITSNLLSPVVIEPDEEILCRGVTSFLLRYYDGTDWLDVWDSTTAGDILPIAIEITLKVQWPPHSANPTQSCTLTRILPLACHKELETTGGAL
ncbi:MAG TPA: type II secretion system protein GspJ [Tepidisphaeraceae bacterium]|nr:type II secretion system protein GspJ [Tepidisphaeraceae bacterium]